MISVIMIFYSVKIQIKKDNFHRADLLHSRRAVADSLAQKSTQIMGMGQVLPESASTPG